MTLPICVRRADYCCRLFELNFALAAFASAGKRDQKRQGCRENGGGSDVKWKLREMCDGAERNRYGKHHTPFPEIETDNEDAID